MNAGTITPALARLIALSRPFALPPDERRRASVRAARKRWAERNAERVREYKRRWAKKRYWEGKERRV